MKKTKYIGFIFALGILSFISGCKHDDEVFEGPSLQDQFGEFAIEQPLTLSTDPVDFSAGEHMIFFAKLSINANWKIEVTGLSSGAKKIIEDNNKVIDDVNATWDGGASGFPAFGVETCAVEMTFPNHSSDTLRDTLTISGLKSEDASITVISNFESGIATQWTEWGQATVTQQILCNDNNSAKGTCYYSMGGIVGWDWGIGNIIFSDSSGSYNLSSNSQAVYFNAGLKGVNSVGTSIMQFSFQEDDNQDGVFDNATEDSWIYEYTIADSSWTLVSFPYADLAGGITNGNGLLEPHKIISVTAFLLADPQAGEVVTHLDQLVFSTNRPYEP